MASFDTYAPLLLRWEGGYVDHPADKGGPTNMGVTLGTFRAKFGQGKTAQDLKLMTYAQWRIIMKDDYWNKLKCDQIKSQSVANMFCDFAVNSGPSRAAKKVQSALGLEADGIVGPKTLAKINGMDSKLCYERIRTVRMSFIKSIVNNDASQQVFYGGWMNRINAIKYVD